jgi:hypothetical protein
LAHHRSLPTSALQPSSSSVVSESNNIIFILFSCESAKQKLPRL